MSETVLVIDSNSAVQAITALALNQTDCTVESLADGAQAYSRIQALKPTVVLCAKEIAGVDPFELCKKIKSEHKGTAFVLLAPADGMKNTSARAKESDFDEVIFKPFKSNRLREVVTELIQRHSGPQNASTTCVVAISDPLRKVMLERVLRNCGVNPSPPTENASGAAIVDWPPPADSQSFDCEKCSPLFVLAATAQKTAVEKRYLNAKVIPLPITAKGILQAFGDAFGPIEFTRPQAEPAVSETAPPSGATPQQTGEQYSHAESELAADISARIFKRLLLSRSLRERDFEEASRLAKDEILKSLKNPSN